MKVHHRERAVGVRAAGQAVLDDWERAGPHEILVAPNGGLRTSEALQAGLAAGGNSGANTLRSTPHGRGAAIDAWPVSFLPFVPVAHGGTGKRWLAWKDLPQLVRDEFLTWGLFLEARGWRWGGRFRGHLFPDGDQPHGEEQHWTRLPFPPPKVP